MVEHWTAEREVPGSNLVVPCLNPPSCPLFLQSKIHITLQTWSCKSALDCKVNCDGRVVKALDLKSNGTFHIGLNPTCSILASYCFSFHADGFKTKLINDRGLGPK